MTGRSSGVVRVGMIACAAGLLSACSSTTTDQAGDAASAQKLVAAAHAAGVAPGLTAEVAESLYGGSAAQVCDVLGGGVSSAESMLLTLNPSGRRAKVITDDAIAYGRLVVQTYCPGELSTYDDLVADMHPVEKTG